MAVWYAAAARSVVRHPFNEGADGRTALLWLLYATAVLMPDRVPWRLAFGRESPEAFLSRALPPYDAARYLNHVVPAGQKVVGVNADNVRFYLDAQLLSVVESFELREWMDRAGEGRLAQSLAAHGCGYLLRNRLDARTRGRYETIEVVPAGRAWTWRQVSVSAPEGAAAAIVCVDAHAGRVWFDDAWFGPGVLSGPPLIQPRRPGRGALVRVILKSDRWRTVLSKPPSARRSPRRSATCCWSRRAARGRRRSSSGPRSR
jgi:hypothetical protein